jgi:uncharacterized repeat protein (TIGR01451 family)
MKTILIVVLGTFVCLTLFASTALSQQSCLDDQVSYSDSYFGRSFGWDPFGTHFIPAQSFVVGMNGRLCGIDLALAVYGSPPEPFLVEVRDISNGWVGPDDNSTTIASRTFQWSDLLASEWTYVDFGSNAPNVQIGQILAVLIRTENEVGYFAWAHAGSDVYLPGEEFTLVGNTWLPSNSIVHSDLFFRSHVEPAPLLPELTFHKAALENPSPADEPVTVLYIVENSGTGMAEQVTIEDAFPLGTEFLSASSSNLCSAPGANPNYVTCLLGDLAPGQSEVITVAVDPGTLEEVCDTAELSALAVAPIFDALCVEVSTTGQPDLVATITDKKWDPLNLPGENYIEMAISNIGTKIAVKVPVYSYLEEDPEQRRQRPAGFETVIESLAPGESRIITVDYRAINVPATKMQFSNLVRAIADPKGMIEEIREDNNQSNSPLP